jgi:uncharacterized protein with PQ loop repeat
MAEVTRFSETSAYILTTPRYIPEDGNIKKCLVVDEVKHFIFVGCILLRCLHMLYKYTTQKLYICDPQTQLNNFLYSSKISLHVSAPTGHLQVIFLKISYSTAIHPSSLQVWGYILLLYLYVYNAKGV